MHRRLREDLRDIRKRQKRIKTGSETLNLPNHSKQHMAVCGLPLHQGSTDGRKTLEQKSIFLIGTLKSSQYQRTLFIQPIHSVVFLRYTEAPTNSVAPSFCIKITHNPQFLESFRRRASAGSVSSRISLRWPMHIINSVDNTKLSYRAITIGLLVTKLVIATEYQMSLLFQPAFLIQLREFGFHLSNLLF